MTTYERLCAERWQPTRFGDSVIDRARHHAERKRRLREAEEYLAGQHG